MTPSYSWRKLEMNACIKYYVTKFLYFYQAQQSLFKETYEEKKRIFKKGLTFFRDPMYIGKCAVESNTLLDASNLEKFIV
jgi:hypothetical protein